MKTPTHTWKASPRRLALAGIASLVIAAFLASLCRAQQAADGAEPGDPVAQFSELQKLAAAGDHAAAAKALRTFVLANAGWDRIPEANVLFGSELILAGEISAGRNILDHSLEKNLPPTLAARAHYFRGKSFEAAGDYPAAILAYDMVLRRFSTHELAPESALDQAILAETVLQNNRRADEILLAFVERYPKDARVARVRNHLAVLSERGVAAKGVAEPAEAVARYRAYATHHPADLGDPVMNGAVAGPTAALRHAAILATQALKDPKLAIDIHRQYETLPRADNGTGFIEAARLAAANAEAGDPRPLFQAALKADPRAEWQLEYARWLKNAGHEADAQAQYLDLVGKATAWEIVREALDQLAPEATRGYLNNRPTDIAAFSHYLQRFKAPEQRPAGREVLDAWLQRNDLDWKTAIAADWYGWTNDPADADRLIQIADAEGYMAVSVATSLKEADGWLPEDPQKSQQVLERALSIWSGYPDFPGGAVAARLAALARKEPLMIPNPAKVAPPPAPADAAPAADAPAPAPAPVAEAAPPPVPDTILSPKAVATRNATIALLTKYGLDKTPIGAHETAGLRFEMTPEDATGDLLRAVPLLLRSKKLAEAQIDLERLLGQLPAPDMAGLELLQQAAAVGPEPWQEFWAQVVVPQVDVRLKAFQALQPATVDSRYATAILRGIQDPKAGIAAHDEFLNQPGAEPRAIAIRWNRLMLMRATKIDTTPSVVAAIKTITDTPAAALSVPSDLIPAGPEGYDRFVADTTAALPKADAALKPQLLLALAQAHSRFGRPGAAVDALQAVVREFGVTPYADQARDLAVSLTQPRAFFPPGYTQAHADQVLAWALERCRTAPNPSLESVLKSNTWRLAGHPAYRRHNFEAYDALYLYSTHQHVEAPKDLSALMSGMYGSSPGDGTGPAGSIENGDSPYRGGDKFMLYRWALLNAPVDGTYHFWWAADDYAGFAIDGQSYNIPDQKGNHAALFLAQGLHLLQVGYGDWGGGRSLTMDWQVPGRERVRLGGSALAAETAPLVLSAAAINQGAGSVAFWDAYLAKYPRDARARAMRLGTLALSEPARAATELGSLAAKYPGNVFYRERLADCNWRLGQRDEAMKTYAALAAERETGRWVPISAAGLYQNYFLGGEAQPSLAAEYRERRREQVGWNLWLAEARTAGDNGEAEARMQAADLLAAAGQRALVRQQGVGRVNAGSARLTAQIEAAKALANKEDAEAQIRAEAAAAATAAEDQLTQLQAELPAAQARAATAAKRLAEFRAAVGVKEGDDLAQLYQPFALAAIGRGTLTPGTSFGISARLWAAQQADAATPFLEHVIRFGTDANQIAWATDRLVDLAVQGKDTASAARILTAIGWREPRNPKNAQWLKRSCDLALEAGNVYLFARNAHLLAALHPDNKDLSNYLDRLGTVFEKAGNYTSAEAEYKRVIATVEAADRKRLARLSLAGLYEKTNRPHDALVQLSKLVDITLPSDGAKPSKPAPAPAPQPKEGEVPAKTPPADAQALLAAVHSYLSLELNHLALDAYLRAAAQDSFGTAVKPDYALLMRLATASLAIRSPAVSDQGQDREDQKFNVLPPAVIARAETGLKLTDDVFRFHAEALTPRQKMDATLLRADANILMRNYPRAVEEVKAARAAIGDSPMRYYADLKMGEIHLATDNADQALPIFRKLARLNREGISPVALFWLGTTQLRVGNREEAVESFRVLWERYAESDLVRQAVFAIARTYAEQGAFLDAIRLYEAVGAINSVRREKVVPGDLLTAKVWDADHYLGTGQHTIPVSVESSCGDVEKLLLDMNKINHSLFLGTIRTELGEPLPNDGILQVYGTDLVYVTYTDKFKSGEVEDGPLTLASVQGGKRTSIIQVVEDGDLSVSPTVFQKDQDEGQPDLYREQTAAELAEEKRLAALSTKLERGQAVIRPGNTVYLRVQDGDLDRGPEPDVIRINVFTYSPTVEKEVDDGLEQLARAYTEPLTFEATKNLPDNPALSQALPTAPQPGAQPRLDTVQVELIETGPHTGVFQGTVKTAVNGPTAVALDSAGEAIPALAIDGRNGADDAWIAFIDGAPDKWLDVDMKEMHKVARIVWDRGEGKDDRYMIDYTVSLRGADATVEIKREGNTSAHANEIILDEPVSCRWIRFTAHTYEGDAPAISRIEAYDADGNKLLPPAVSPLERVSNGILEFNVGDCMAATYTDEENITPGRPLIRTSNPLGVAYVDGRIDAVSTSMGTNRVQGTPITTVTNGVTQTIVYGRRTKRIATDAVLQLVVVDPDLDLDEELNSVQCEVISSSGDRVELTAKELDKTAAIFKARIQLSPSPEAKDDGMRLWVRAGDCILLRYRDQENRHPGHAVYRESFIFAADDELASFPDGVVMGLSPQTEEDSLAPPNWQFQLREPDQALPGQDRLEMQVLSFATGDQARFDLLLQDLDGTFASRLPVAMADRPEIDLPPDAKPGQPRRIRALEERRWTAARGGGRDQFDLPLAVVGDDIVWMSYQDTTNQRRVARLFVPVVPAWRLDQLARLGTPVLAPPPAAVEQGLTIALKDPYLELKEAGAERQRQILREIARKKRHYRLLLAEYQTTLEMIGKRIGTLDGEERSLGTDLQGDEAAPAPPTTVDGGDAPLTIAETLSDVPLTDAGELAIEDVIRATALRRDRDGLAAAMQQLQLRLEALSKYDTDAIEAEIGQQEQLVREALAAAEAADDDGSTETVGAPTEPPTPWYTQPDWWQHCGGIVPGTSLKIQINDPDIEGEHVVVTIMALGGNAPRHLEFTATAVPDQPGFFEVLVPTSQMPTDKGVMLAGARHLEISYRETAQQTFVARRSGYMSLASDAVFETTESDFLQVKESFHLGESIYVVIEDADMDKTSTRDYVWVEVRTPDGDVERVPIRESQPHSGVFRGNTPSRLGDVVPGDGILQGDFGSTFTLTYVDALWRRDSPIPPELALTRAFVTGSDGEVEIFARQLKRGALQRDVLFNTALAEYELGKSSTEMGVVQKGRAHLLGSREKFQMLVEEYQEDDVCAHATYYLGNINFLLGDYPGAVQNLQRVIDRWPKTEFKAMALFKLGTCHIKAGKFDRAVESFVNLAYHHPDSPLVADAMLILAQHFSRNKLYKPATGIGEAFIRKFPGHDKTGNVYLRVAGWLIMEEKYGVACELLDQAEKSLPDSELMPAFLYWHADCIFKTSSPGDLEYKRGVTILQRVTYDYPDSKWAKYASARLVEVDIE